MNKMRSLINRKHEKEPRKNSRAETYNETSEKYSRELQ